MTYSLKEAYLTVNCPYFLFVIPRRFLSFEYTLTRTRDKDPTVNTTVEILGGLHGLKAKEFLVETIQKPEGCGTTTVGLEPYGFRRALSALRKNLDHF